MAPNGMMSVYTGLLLRTQNEAQLAAVLGHEIGHYLARHSLQRFEVEQATMTATGILGMGLGAAGLGGLGPSRRSRRSPDCRLTVATMSGKRTRSASS